jgi:hypothetical protein
VALTARFQSFDTEGLAGGGTSRPERGSTVNAWLGQKPYFRPRERCWTWIPTRFLTASRNRVLRPDIWNPEASSCCCSTGRGDCPAAKLPPCNVHSAKRAEELPLPEIDRQQKPRKQAVFRAGLESTPALPAPAG